ncbi:MAG: response regulator [Crocinitomicaceae bacterium]|jgi:CheY-like chemotaxis protein|nr:response regulator [Crocinitomicaceae bacterium]
MKNSDSLFSILIAEDDEDDYTLITDAIKSSQNKCQVNWVRDGEELLDFLNTTNDLGVGKNKRPDIILLDLNMPKKDGREALEEIKSHPKFKNIPVIVLTTSQAKMDIQKVYDLGANSFIQKPFKYADFSSMMESFFKYWIHTVKLP